MAVEVSTDGPVGIVILNRPPANSYNLRFVEELRDAVDAVAADADVRVVVVRSASEKFFSAGADVKAFRENPVEHNMRIVELAHETLAGVAEIPKVFVAEIAGHALGGGLEIALACDLRFAADGDERLGLPEVTLGLLPGNGGTQRLPRLIGPARALDLMVTGRQVGPQEAHQLGIVDRLVPPGDLEDETRAFAERLAHGATKAIGNIKLAVRRGVDRRLRDGLALERELLEELFRSEDATEGLAAFAEKRQPDFTGA
jgi:enoyl-CoA hydratase/carnithine racemase